MNCNRSLVLTLLSFASLLGGCADPAAHAPDAAVADAPATAPIAAEAAAPAGVRYRFTEGSSIGFEGSKVTGSHEGGFAVFSGSIELVGGDPAASRVEVTIETNSVWTDSERLTGHLKSADFFDVETYPAATFVSSAIAAAEGIYTVTGTLELHGVAKQITFPATIIVDDGTIDIQAEFSINRFDFGIEYPGKADDLIRPEVLLSLDLQAEPEVEEPEEAA